MMDDSLPGKPTVMFDFNLPYGLGVEEHNVDQEFQQNVRLRNEQEDEDNTEDLSGNSTVASVRDNDSGTDDQSIADQDLNYRQFSPSFSNDEGSGEAFERSYASYQAKKRTTNATKDKKSPRRSDIDEEDYESSTRAKKPCQSLFVGPEEETEEGEQIDSLFASATLGHCIGNGISSLKLDQQLNRNDGLERPINPGFGLACSDIGSVCNSPVPSDEEFMNHLHAVVSRSYIVSVSRRI
jgi:hypothetical protein